MTNWIKAKERMPEGDEVVLVVCRGKLGNITFEDAIAFGYFSDGKWYLDEWISDENGNDYEIEVSHWMELPEMPEEVWNTEDGNDGKI